ncbi:NACHT and WD40 repeat domain-containing protein [Lentzea sp. NEAU-D7]|uniref:NACHT and WD40 repeat domain-containing protein n=1 Tax=Lentzea sp. NEAU-D7 TaxID=2994667 RepID=UPI00224B73F0|nr:hypothetical protein [Lentzea sp. NEAU-D7]MCX2953653.1 hypothetical protein [Lentzea sp. NEAU-D7]
MKNAIKGTVNGTAVQTGVVEGDLVITTGQSASGVSLAVTVAVASAVAVVWAVAGGGSGGWLVGAGLAGLLVAAGGAAWAFRAARTPPSLENRLTELREVVTDQWKDEVTTRGLAGPRPLRLRWRPTERRAQVGSLPESAPLVGALVQDTGDDSPVAHQLAAEFLRGPHHQLVVLGEPGAGKTTLAVLFTIAAAAHDRVPVLFPVAGWQPHDPSTGTGEHVEHWIARRLAADYGSLVDGVPLSRLLPVLDGLDEMSEDSLGKALTDLDRVAGSDLRMVITCRGQEFEEAVAESGVLTRAAVVDIERIRPEDAEVYLTQAEVREAGPGRWQAVTRTLTDDPSGPVAAALSTPLMISLARRVYKRPREDPGELTRLGSKEQIEHHLLEQFLVAAYPRDRDRDRARHWLSFLAAHLRDRVGDTELEWWRIARAVPPFVLTLLITAIITLSGAALSVTSWGLLDESGDDLIEYAFGGAVLGLPVGLVAGLNVARAAHTSPSRERRHVAVIAAAGVGRDLAVIVSIVCGAAAIALLSAYVVAAPATTEFVIGVRESARTPSSARDFLSGVLISVTILGVATLTNGVVAGRDGTPHRSSSSVRGLFLHLPIGVFAGLIIGSPWLIMAATWRVDDSIMLWLVTAAAVGVPLAIGRWLAAPAPWSTAPSPLSVLRTDRTATLLTTVVTGVCGGLATAAAVAFSSDSHVGVVEAAAVASIAIPVISIVVLFGTGTAWSVYTVARIWLALRGHLPWRLMRFLGEAHGKGVLRSAGPSYQLRHDLLRGYLADRWRGSPVTAPNSTRLKRKHPAIVAVTMIGLLFVSAALVEAQSPLRRIYSSEPSDVAAISFSGDGRKVVFRTRWSVVVLDLNSGESSALTDSGGSGTVTGIDHDGTTCTLYEASYLTKRRCTSKRSWDRAAKIPDRVSPVALSPNGATLVLVEPGGRLFYVDTVTLKGKYIADSDAPVIEGAFSSDSQVLALAGEDRSILVSGWDGSWHWTTTSPETGLSGLAVAGNGEHVAVVDSVDVVHLLHKDGTRHSLAGARTAFSPDSEVLAVAGAEGGITFWSSRTGQLITTVDTGDIPVLDLAFSPDGSALATAGTLGRVLLWDVPPRPE